MEILLQQCDILKLNLVKLLNHLTEDLEKNTVNYRNNYDETEKEPEVLTISISKYISQWCWRYSCWNGNKYSPLIILGEVINGTIAYIENKDITISVN